MNTKSYPITVFLSFADSRMAAAIDRIGKQAEQMGVFDKIYVYNENDLDAHFRAKWSHILRAGVRGFGYWCWKPQIILQVLKSLPENSRLLYCDAGCHLNPRGKDRLEFYFQELMKDSLGIKAFPAYSPFVDDLEKRWTKGDVFDYFQCRNNKFVTHSPQIAATQILCRSCSSAISFLNAWNGIIETNVKLLDDSSSKSPNLNGYIAHRHDQSLFSILFKLNGGTALPPNETEGIPAGQEIKQPIWAKRDRGYKDMRLIPFIKRNVKARLFLLKVKMIKLREKYLPILFRDH